MLIIFRTENNRKIKKTLIDNTGRSSLLKESKSSISLSSNLTEESDFSIFSGKNTATDSDDSDDEIFNKFKERNQKFKKLSTIMGSSYETPVTKKNQMLRQARLVKTQQVKKGLQKTLTFIESLSEVIEHENLRDPAVKDYFKKFRSKNGKNELLRECFNRLNAAAFDNRLPQNMKLSWSSRLTATGGFCKNNLVAKTSEIQISSKVCDTPGILLD